MSPYEALVLVALLLAIASEWEDYLDDRDWRQRRERIAREWAQAAFGAAAPAIVENKPDD